MESGTRFKVHVDQFKEIALQMETVSEPLDDIRQLVLLLGSLTDDSHVTSVRDKFVSLKTPVRITIADGRKIDAVAMGTVGLKLMGDTSVTLSDVLYIPEVEGNLISVAKLAEKDVIAQFSKDNCAFHFGGATIMGAKRCENVYKLKIVGDEVCHAATTQICSTYGPLRRRLVRPNPNLVAGRGAGFSGDEVQNFLETIKEQLSLGLDEWKLVLAIHNQHFRANTRTVKLSASEVCRSVSHVDPDWKPDMPPRGGDRQACAFLDDPGADIGKGDIITEKDIRISKMPTVMILMPVKFPYKLRYARPTTALFRSTGRAQPHRISPKPKLSPVQLLATAP
ncbi:unnamed protein product [Phytophthora fragariaefolia]|uniref:Unnamed protein product n=1 Tax=Phytophthora fragariaefolia TaxID=1490495 RepID=A0A9W7CY73_9STRA|nr:unnamed protein product [Phytophthora fragariaefolia]